MEKIKRLIQDFIFYGMRSEINEAYWEELLSPSCSMATILGRMIGSECIMGLYKNLFSAFPDALVEINSLQIVGNVAICQAEFNGTHEKLFTVEHTDPTSGTLLVKSDFSLKFSQLAPTFTPITQKGEMIFVFDNDKVVRFTIHEDLTSLYRQLGIDVKTEKIDDQTILKREFHFLIGKICELLSYLLSPHECISLSFAISGFTSKHTANILGNSFRTIESHLQCAYAKLECIGKQQCLELIVSKNMLLIFQDLCRVIREITENSRF